MAAEKKRTFLVQRFLLRVFLILCLTVVGGVFYFLRVVLIDDRLLPFPDVSGVLPQPRLARIDLTDPPPLRQSPSSSTETVDIGREHPQSQLAWVAEKPGVVRVTLPEASGRTRLSALVGQAGETYEWSGVLPKGASLAFRAGLLSRGAGFRFMVDVLESTGTARRVYSQRMDSPRHRALRRWPSFFSDRIHDLLVERAQGEQRWVPAWVDLSDCAGRPLRIQWRVEKEGRGTGLAFWGAPEIRFPLSSPVVPAGSRQRPGGPPANVVWVALETTPEREGFLASVPAQSTPQLRQMFSDSVSFARFYTTDVRTLESLRQLFFPSVQISDPFRPLPSASPAPWPALLRANGYRTLAVGAFSEAMMSVLLEAGFDEIHQLPHDGNDSVETARRAVGWVAEKRNAPFLVFAFFRDLPADRLAPARFWVPLLRRVPRSRVEWTRVRRAAQSSYLDESFGRLAMLLENDSEPPLFGVASLRGAVADPTPVRRLDTGRRGTVFLDLPGGGLRESEIRAFCGFRQGTRFNPALLRAPGNLADVGPTLLRTLDLSVDKVVAGRAWDLTQAPVSEDSSGRWVVRSLRSKVLILDGRFKYIRHSGLGPLPNNPDLQIDFPSEEVFDLWADPQEQRNLARSRRSLLARLREVLEETDPDPIEIRLGFRNPAGLRLDGVVTCSGGQWNNVRADFPLRHLGPNEFSFSTEAAAATVRFRPLPVGSAYLVHFWVDGRPLSKSQIQVGRWGLPLFESTGDAWHDKTKFDWMDGWREPAVSTTTLLSIGRVSLGQETSREGGIP